MARRNSLDELREAIEQGADTNLVDEFGMTALLHAIAHRNETAALMLIESRADVTIPDAHGMTSLHYAVDYRLYDVAAAILRKNSEVIHVADKHGNQPLWTAAFGAKGDYRLVELLLKNGADVEHKNKVGLSPHEIPRRTGDSQLLEILERHLRT